MQSITRPLRLLAVIFCLVFTPGFAFGQAFHMIALPDTQGYSGGYYQTFMSQTQWIVNNRESKNIAFVTHLGDIVNTSINTTEWTRADAAMDLLNGVVPYSACEGNHDSPGPNYDTYFGPSRYAGQSWYGGSSSSQRSQYQQFSAGGYNFLHLNLEYGPDDETFAWAQSVIDSHPGMPTIISTHDYLGYTGRSLYGEAIWNNLAKTNSQVLMILNGHWHGEGQQTSLNSEGGRVIEMLSDYQAYSGGGDGYLRDIFFDVPNNRIEVKTYSPTRNAYMTDSDSQFSFDVTFGDTIRVNHLIEPSLPPPPAYTLTFQEGVGGYIGTQDTALASATPDTKQGGGDSMIVGTAEGTPTGPSQGLVRFDNIFGDAKGKITPQMKVTSASLTLTVSETGSGWSAHRMLTNWSEASTWNSTAGGIQANGVEAQATAEASIGANNSAANVDLGRWNMDVLDSVKAWQDGQANQGWALLPLTPNGTNGTKIDSSEMIATNNHPKLTVTVEMNEDCEQAVFQQGRNGYNGTHDLELRQEEPDTAAVYESVLTITSDDRGKTWDTQNMIRFDRIFGSGPGQIPLDADIAFARLILNVSESGSGFALHRMLQPWDESASWNSFEYAIQADGVEAMATPDIRIGASNYYSNIPAGIVQLDVTEALQAWLAGEANYGWVILPYSRGGNGLDWCSSKYQTVSLRPMLVVDYTAPEPTAMMLLLAGAGWAMRRKRSATAGPSTKLCSRP